VVLFSCQPTIGKEVIDLGSLGRRKPGQNIFEILAGIDVEALASFDQAHDGCSGLTTFLRAGKKPITSTEHHRFDASFASVVADFDEGMIEVNEQSRPAIERIRDCFSKFSLGEYDRFLFIKPFFKHFDLGTSQALAQIISFGSRKCCCQALNVKETLDDAHWKFCRLTIVFPGVFEVTMHMRPAVSGGSSFLDDLVVLIGAVRLKNAGKACQNSFRIERVLSVRVVEEDVRMVSVSTVVPYISSVSLAETLFDDWQGGGIRLNDPAFQNELSHPPNDWSHKSGSLFQPPAHGRAIDWDAERVQDLFLPIEGQMQPEFIGCYFGNQPRTRQTFINRLVGLLGRDHLSSTFLASVLKDNVLDCLEKSLDKLDLMRDIKANDLAWQSAAWTRNFACRDAMFFLTSFKMRRWNSASAAMFILRHNVQSLLLGIEFIGSLIVNDFAGAGQKSSINFCRFTTKSLTIAAAKLFFQFSDASKQFSDELVAVFDIIWQWGVWIVLGRLFWHDYTWLANHYIIQ
jgi:hypothetical protein